MNILDSIEWIFFWMNILDFVLNEYFFEWIFWILFWIEFWIESFLGQIQWKNEFSKRIEQGYIMVTSREAGSWVCPENWGPTPVCQFVRPTALANEQSLTFLLCYIIQGLGTVFCENMVGQIGWVPISRSCGNSQICWSRTHQCSGREKVRK